MDESMKRKFIEGGKGHVVDAHRKRMIEDGAAYKRGPAKTRARLELRLLPRFEGLRADFLKRLEEYEPKLAAMSDEEAGSLYKLHERPSWYTALRELEREIREACNPYLRKDELVDGAVYRIRCRNADCGVWREGQAGFEIPRRKFGSLYLFVEYHWDNGPPLGTSRPYERLEDLPTEAVSDGSKLLAYLAGVDEVCQMGNRRREELNLNLWDPLPAE